jgi:hypothetical protein
VSSTSKTATRRSGHWPSSRRRYSSSTNTDATSPV